jgi:hypothetical protein
LPDGQKLNDLDDFVKMFYIYVIGFSPSIESISNYVNYELELRKINEKDVSIPHRYAINGEIARNSRRNFRGFNSS